MNATLYEQSKQQFDRLAAEGFPHIAEMSRLFRKAADMDRALGYDNAAARWARGAGWPSGQSERKAKAFLVARREREQESAQPMVPQPKADNALFLVACSPDQAVKAKKLLAIIGCELVDV